MADSKFDIVRLLQQVKDSTGLNERKGKALLGQLLSTVDTVASDSPTSHIPDIGVSKVLRDAVPKLKTYTRLAAKEQCAPTTTTDGLVNSNTQLVELLEHLGVDNKPEAPVEVAAAFYTFLDGVLSPQLLGDVEVRLPWLSDTDPTMSRDERLGQMKAAAEMMKDNAGEMARDAGQAAVSTINRFESQISGESPEQIEEKKRKFWQKVNNTVYVRAVKKVINFVVSPFKKLFRMGHKSEKGKEAVSDDVGSGDDDGSTEEPRYAKELTQQTPDAISRMVEEPVLAGGDVA